MDALTRAEIVIADLRKRNGELVGMLTPEQVEWITPLGQVRASKVDHVLRAAVEYIALDGADEFEALHEAVTTLTNHLPAWQEEVLRRKAQAKAVAAKRAAV